MRLEPQLVPKCFLRFLVDMDHRVVSAVSESDVFLLKLEHLIGMVAKSHNGRFVKLMDVADLHSLVRQAIFLTRLVPTEVDLAVSTYLRLMPLRDPQLVKLVLSMPKKGILLVAGEI